MNSDSFENYLFLKIIILKYLLVKIKKHNICYNNKMKNIYLIIIKQKINYQKIAFRIKKYILFMMRELLNNLQNKLLKLEIEKNLYY